MRGPRATAGENERDAGILWGSGAELAGIRGSVSEQGRMTHRLERHPPLPLPFSFDLSVPSRIAPALTR